MSDCVDSKTPFKDADTIQADVLPVSDASPGSAGTLRRAWLARDAEAYIRQLEVLAPQFDYSSRGLARALRISPRHLQRIFAATLGRAPQAWLNEQRLLAARQMLPSAGTVKEVAYSLGFHSASQLSRDFKCYFGIAPSTLIDPALRAAAQGLLQDSNGAVERKR
jgi:AraC-like DNA-binding protein